MRYYARGNINCHRSYNGSENNNNYEYNNPYNPDYEGYSSSYGYGGFYGYPRQIFEYNQGNNVDLTNLNVGDRVTVAQLTIDTGVDHRYANNGMGNNNTVVKISFSTNLNYTMTLNEEMDLLFKLYRQDRNGARVELTSVPYRVSFYGEEETETQLPSNLQTELAKDETFYTEYFDELQRGGEYTYIMEVGPTYSSIDSASIQGGYISAEGQMRSGCRR